MIPFQQGFPSLHHNQPINPEAENGGLHTEGRRSRLKVFADVIKQKNGNGHIVFL